MNEATIAITILSFLLFTVFLGFFIWALKTGQFKNAEEAKYHVFRNLNGKPDRDENRGQPKPEKEVR